MLHGTDVRTKKQVTYLTILYHSLSSTPLNNYTTIEKKVDDVTVVCTEEKSVSSYLKSNEHSVGYCM